MLKGKHILLGVTGGISAYKSAELIRLLVKEECSVKVIMTKHAGQFITPLTLQTLSGNPVFMDMFSLIRDHDIAHVALAEEADALIIAPATANIIGKMAAGMADDLLTTVALATRAPVMICPAMNPNMYGNTVVRENMRKLADRGCHIMAAAEGELACGTEGWGRLPEPQQIVDEVHALLTAKDLAGKRILVTAGPTREPFDPVRFITNYSSGKMGYALAIAARRRGASVTLISGPSALAVPSGVDFISVSSAVEMLEAVMKHLKEADVVIKSAAVADYRPSIRADAKIKKKSGPLSIALERNPDILAEVGKVKEGRILIGFAMESENLVENAKAKLLKKNLDLIVANDVNQSGAGFETDTNIVKILDRAGGIEELPLMDKMEVAGRILDRVRRLMKQDGATAHTGI